MAQSRMVTSWEKVPVIFDIPYAACLLGINPETLRCMVKDGQLPAFKVGKKWKIKKEHFISWVEEQHN